MKAAEHVKLNCSAQSMTKSKMKKGNTGMISATHNLVKRSGKMMKTSFETHVTWTHGVRVSSKMTTNEAHNECKRRVRVSAKKGSMTYGEEISA